MSIPSRTLIVLAEPAMSVIVICDYGKAYREGVLDVRMLDLLLKQILFIQKEDLIHRERKF